MVMGTCSDLAREEDGSRYLMQQKKYYCNLYMKFIIVVSLSSSFSNILVVFNIVRIVYYCLKFLLAGSAAVAFRKTSAGLDFTPMKNNAKLKISRLPSLVPIH